jgi:hypothetical protein
VCVELHHSPLGRRASLPGVPTSTDFWHGVRESKIAGANLRGGRAWALEPTLALLVACLHFGHSDHISWRVTHLIDATRLAELHADEIDWERLLLHATWPDLGRALALPLFYLAREGLPTAPAEALDRLVRRAGLRSWENRFLAALIDRYRFGIPGPWRVLSRRAANIVWGRALRSGSTLGRGWSALRLALRRRKRKPPSRAAGRRPLPEGQALGAP